MSHYYSGINVGINTREITRKFSNIFKLNSTLKLRGVKKEYNKIKQYFALNSNKNMPHLKSWDTALDHRLKPYPIQIKSQT